MPSPSIELRARNQAQRNVRSTASELPTAAETEGKWTWLRSFVGKWSRKVVGKVVLTLLGNLIVFLAYLVWSNYLQPLFTVYWKQLTLSTTLPNNDSSSMRPAQCLTPECQLIRTMTRSAWVSLKLADSPSVNPGDSMPIAICLSSLWVMNLTDEFEQAKSHLKWTFTLKEQSFPVQTLVANILGGFLSAYALTKDRLFLEKATEFAKLLEPAYNQTTGLAVTHFNGATATFENAYTWGSTLSDIGGQHLEYVYLAALTGKDWYRLWAQKRRTYLVSRKTTSTLYQENWPLSEAQESENSNRTKGASFSVHSSAYYRSLLGSVVQSNYRHTSALELYIETIEALAYYVVKRANDVETREELAYTGTLNYARDSPLYTTDEMRAQECFLGAMLAQGAETIKLVKLSQFLSIEGETYQQIEVKHQKLATQLTDMCTRIAARTESKLLPLTFRPMWLYGVKDTSSYLGPELAQSYFTLWRLTHAQKYRDAAWKMVQAIERYCKTPAGGYAELRNVNDPTEGHTNGDASESLSLTLLYLYLTFTDDSVLPLSRWFSNSAGHLLPICGVNDAYPNCPI